MMNIPCNWASKHISSMFYLYCLLHLCFKFVKVELSSLQQSNPMFTPKDPIQKNDSLRNHHDVNRVIQCWLNQLLFLSVTGKLFRFNE